MRASKRTRARFYLFNSPGLVQEGKNLSRQSLWRQLVLRKQPGGARTLHYLCVAGLMGISGGPERDKDGGASGGRYLRDSDCARPANNQVGLGKPLRHIFDEGDDLRLKLASRIGTANAF